MSLADVVMPLPPGPFAQPPYALLDVSSVGVGPNRTAPASATIELVRPTPARRWPNLVVGGLIVVGGVGGLAASATHGHHVGHLAMAAFVAVMGVLALLPKRDPFARRLVIDAGELRVWDDRDNLIASLRVDEIAALETVEHTRSTNVTMMGIPIGPAEHKAICLVRLYSRNGVAVDLAQLADIDAAWWLEDTLRVHMLRWSPEN